MKLKSNLEAKPPKLISDLRDLVRSSMETFGDKIVYSYVEKGEVCDFTYTDLWEDMNRLGTALARRSFRGRRIAVIGELHPGWVTTYLAAVNGGNVIVPLDKDIDDDHMPQFLELAEVSAVFYTSGSASKIEGMMDRLPRVELFVPINPPDGFSGDDRTVPYGTLLEEGQKALDEGCTDFTEYEIEMEPMCTLLFTSGTTGTSKGVMLSQKNLTAAVNSSCLSMAYDDKNTFVSVLPPHHTYEMTCTNLSMINIGAWVFINDSLKHVVRNFSNFKPNTLILVPLFVETMYKKIWDQIEKKGLKKKVRLAMAASDAMLKVGIDRRSKLFSQILDAFGGNIRSIVCGGAPLSPKLIRDFYSFGIIILEGYGITECSPLVAVNSPDNIKLRSVG
ncbi:MAG: AMP-binding protein, partial [Clostridia bacterium]|nr:AMP-binding protein [Clostridia bacterium]